MNTAELIKWLQDADPSGELECVVGNIPILYADKNPAYYDGCYQYLVRDDKGHFDFSAAEIRGDGEKVQIHTMSIASALWDAPEMPVACVGMGEATQKRYEEYVEEWRKEPREYEAEEARECPPQS